MLPVSAAEAHVRAAEPWLPGAEAKLTILRNGVAEA